MLKPSLLRSFVSIFFIFSSSAFAGGILTFRPGFETKDKIEVANMPPVRSQDGLGLCASFAVATLLDFQNCKTKKINCSELSQNEQFSSLDISSFALNTNRETGEVATEPHQKVYIGANSPNILGNLESFTDTLARESCAPFESELNLSAKSAEKAVQEVDDIKAKFERKKTEADPCLECLAKEINAAYPNLGSLQQLKEKLKEPDYEKFLHKLLIPDSCLNDKSQRINLPKYSVRSYPGEGEMPQADSAIEKAKKLFKNGIPVLVDGICMDDVKPGKDKRCKESHTLVIYGYSRKCDVRQCYDAFRVQNSWGKRWQDENGDGWVDARQLIEWTHSRGSVFTWLN